jgi:hypothetical protein
MTIYYRSYADASLFEAVINTMEKDLLSAPEVLVGEWQAIVDESHPAAKTWEIHNALFEMPIPYSIDLLQEYVNPNLPWAEDHFQERVGGEPLNPPPSEAWWPYARRGNRDFKNGEKFSHTYPERMWPKAAGENNYEVMSGIRYPYGDLGTLLATLVTRPGTRQAYLPIWFPEDGYAVSMGARVPCSIGYHFLIRGNQLHCTYTMRSCDLIRHFRDDVYMAARLTQWLARELEIIPGTLTMLMSSLHIFAPDRIMLAKKYPTIVAGGVPHATYED